MSDRERRSFDELQRSYFDNAADHFIQPVPDEVQQRTSRIVAAAELKARSRVLDVGTGAGVLINYFLSQKVQPENIVGCDLSEGMLSKARQRHPQVTFWPGDIVDFPDKFGKFDAIFFNACFGNFFNQDAVILRGTQLLSNHGCLVISHPMGSSFVAALKEQYPQIVPHLLPKKAQLLKWCAQHELTLETYCNEKLLYIAVLRVRQA